MKTYAYDPEDRQRRIDDANWRACLKPKPSEAEVLRLAKQMEQEERKEPDLEPKQP